ncbi:MAG: hypothetical protein HZB55_22420 [Deltaproteobacteria bacterium]|nr:hypothetical protein [Deltaproteobacteria bacterium]
MRYRYFASQGATEEGSRDGPAGDAALGALSARLLRNYDLKKAFEQLKWDGLLDANGAPIDGLETLLEETRELKAGLLGAYTLSRVLNPLRSELLELCEEADPRDAGEGDAQEDDAPFRAKVPEFQRWLQTEFPRDLAGRILALLDEAPRTTAVATIRSGYEQLWGKASGFSLVFGAVASGGRPPPAEAVEGLRRAVAAVRAGSDAEFQSFEVTYAGVLPLRGEPRDWLRAVQEKRTAHEALLASLAGELRVCLHEVAESVPDREGLPEALRSVWRALDELVPRQKGKPYPFSGQRALDLDSGLDAVVRLRTLERLEEEIVRARITGSTLSIDLDLLEEALGAKARRGLEALNGLADELRAEGYVEGEEDGTILSAKALRRIGALALAEVFSEVRAALGRTTARRSGPTHALAETTKPYEFGDPLHLDISGTLANALRRTPGGGLPLRIAARDFEVHEVERRSRRSSVLLLDLSSSMDDKLPAAKKVALALQELARRWFRADRFQLVGFYTLARPLEARDLLGVRTVPYLEGHIPRHWSREELAARDRAGAPDFPGDFTNIQEGLRLSRELLAREKNRDRHILLITDGEPTACTVEGTVLLEGECTDAVLAETLREAALCQRRGIEITTFMMGASESARMFAEALRRAGGGRSFLTSPDDLERGVVVDYLTAAGRARGPVPARLL